MAVKGGGSEYENKEERKAWEERRHVNHKEAKADKREEKGSDTQRKSMIGREISGKVESKGDGRIRKNEGTDRKQKKEYVKEKKVYNKTETKEDNSVDDFGKEICLEMVRAVNMCREFERGCDEFSLYLVYCKEEVVRWQGDWRVANVMETYDEWRARRNIEKVEAKRKRQEVERRLVRSRSRRRRRSRNLLLLAPAGFGALSVTSTLLEVPPTCSAIRTQFTLAFGPGSVTAVTPSLVVKVN